ncbi:MAG: endonuclease/exonuclease/phosphatase family protein [Mycobacteriales bacterium]
MIKVDAVSAAAEPLRVLCWNRFRYSTEPARDRWRRWKAQAHAISEVDPDVLVLLKVDLGPAGWWWLRNRLGMRGLITDGFAGFKVAVLWRSPIKLVSRRSLPMTYRGQYLAVTLRVPGWPRPVRVVAQHADPHSPDNRLQEAQHLRQFAAADEMTLFAGDWNITLPGDPEPDWTPLMTDQKRERLAQHICWPVPTGTDPVADRRAGLYLIEQLKLTNVAAHLHRGDRSTIQPTIGHHRMDLDGIPRRVDAFFVTRALVPHLAPTGFLTARSRNCPTTSPSKPPFSHLSWTNRRSPRRPAEAGTRGNGWCYCVPRRGSSATRQARNAA